MFKKVLVANRGEIAIRALRAAHELGAQTVAVFPYEDRFSSHRMKADEAYQIGSKGHPVAAYLDVSEIIRVATASGADAIYPGYGFLSENPELAEAAERAGIAFIGPPASVLRSAGNKVLAKQQARSAGVPVLASTEPSRNIDELVEGAKKIGFPVFVKAVAGGGGRGMRRVERIEELTDALTQAMREADSAFGDSTMFVEQAVLRPRHIEVQILADGNGNVVHLYERDCSVQRRHQKVIEIAPAPNLDPELRGALCRDAVKFAASIGYENAGTVEFLVDTAGERAGQHVFIEMNPRIQVEHTVTEEVTDVDLVRSQMLIASGATLEELELAQENIHVNGAALQCRITTENPADSFRPDLGKITTYRSPGGAGVRLDGGTLTLGAQVSPYFDSMLVKLTCRGKNLTTAINRAERALAEFRIRGVHTNIDFIRAVLEDEDFRRGEISTAFIEERPQLITERPSGDRATKLATWLADVTVNQPNGPRLFVGDPKVKLPDTDLKSPPQAGGRQRLQQLGPVGFAAALRSQNPLAVTDTTMRDAHQSLLATRVRTRDLFVAAPYISRLTPELFSMEAWGGATYDVALRFLAENPWDRLASLRDAMPNIPIQMLIRGQNAVGYTPYPAQVSQAFVQEAANTGVDIFRIFDALNNVDRMKPTIAAVLETGTAVAEGAISFTGNFLDPAEDKFTLDYYLRLAEQIVDAGAHILGIKDMAGLLRPSAARILVESLRSRFDLPVHLHTHDTAGGQLATLIAASDAGVDAVDVASAPLSGTTSQPSLSALVAALANTERDTGLSAASVFALEPYWEAVRNQYQPFESGLKSSTGRVYMHEIPGGQLSNLRQQAIALGVEENFERVEELYAAADKILGRIPKVTPSSKVVGDLALSLVGTQADPDQFAATPENYDLPESVIGFLQGELGDLPGGWPEPFRSKALLGKDPLPEPPVLSEEDVLILETPGRERQNALNRLFFPKPTQQYQKMLDTYGDLSVLPTQEFLHGLQPGVEHTVELRAGVTIHISLEAIGEADSRGIRTVMTKVNGQLRPVSVLDLSVAVTDVETEKADLDDPRQVSAPFTGVVTNRVTSGQQVVAGDVLATVEAMKMESSITAPMAGVVTRALITGTQQTEIGDLLFIIDPAQT